jgi:16S rRNA (uracil1498-N3)-methyltransferase
MHRFYTHDQLTEGSHLILDQEVMNQMAHVLRFKPGEDVVLFSDQAGMVGWNFIFRIREFRPNGVAGEIVAKIKNDREPKISLVLFQSMLKKDKMEWIFEKGTEVGVAGFVPMLADRSIKPNVNEDRGKKITKEAAEQSGRATVPFIYKTLEFADAVTQAKEDGGLLILAHEGEEKQRLEGLPLSGLRINLFIGPEGGFSDKEVEVARTAGFHVALLSRRIFRAETAAITASYFLLHRYGF